MPNAFDVCPATQASHAHYRSARFQANQISNIKHLAHKTTMDMTAIVNACRS